MFRLLTFLPGRQAWAYDPQSGVNAWLRGKAAPGEGRQFILPRATPVTYVAE